MVAFTIFGLKVHYYGIMITLGILAAYIVCGAIMRKFKYKDDIVFELLLLLVPVAILGARLYFIIFSGKNFSEFFDFAGGVEGIAIYGAVIGGAVALLVYCLFIRKSSFFALSDIIVVGLILAQSIGRWGNFFNKELYGAEANFYLPPITIDIYGSYHYALFFYESVLNLIGFFILLRVISKQKKWGTTTAIYFIFYGVIRAVLEPLRLEGFKLMFLSVPVSVIVSGICVFVGFVILCLNSKNWLPQHNAKLLKVDDDSVKEEDKT